MTQAPNSLPTERNSGENGRSDIVLDREHNEESWQYILDMLNLEGAYPKGEDLETCLSFTEARGIGVLSKEAETKIRSFVKRNPDLKKGVIACIESVRNGSFDSLQVLNLIVNPYTSYFGEGFNNSTPTYVNQVLIGGEKKNVELFIKMPELGD